MGNTNHVRPGLSGQQKITDHHRARLAYIYIRQSTREQVLRHTGSQITQYQLVERAEHLGWSKERIQVIDSDLGVSARESNERHGFQELVAEVSLGHVGIILGSEVSRLARNNRDWYHLLDLAAVFDTLIADCDGIYNLRLYNDRLLLGLKGTMSEAELHLLRQRMEAGRMRKIEQGEYRQTLPTGLVRLPAGNVVKDPDAQVRHTIELVFAKFEELGSCRQVLRYLRDADLWLPRRQTQGPQVGEVVWKRATHAGVYALLTNPAYAGAFAYGRTQLDPTQRQPGRKDTGFIRKPMDEWIHLEQDVYPAYLTWKQYLRNQERLRQNATRFQEQIQRGQGPVRSGEALLQGLGVCGHCGHRLQLSYKPVHRYFCNELTHELGEPQCASFHGPAVDVVVVEAFLKAIEPAQLDLLDAVLEAQEIEQKRLHRQWEERIQRAQYEAQLAQRRYHQVDPDNRLVAAELERQWEEQLGQLQTTQEAYARFRQTSAVSTLSPEHREQFRHLSETLPALWHSGQLANEQKKELLRTLIANVILRRTTTNTTEVKIVWVSGHYSVFSAHPPVYRMRQLHRYDELVVRIQALWQQGDDDAQIALRLSSEGFRSPRSFALEPRTVQRIRLENGWKRDRTPFEDRVKMASYLTVADLAQRLGVDKDWVYRRIRNHKLDPVHVVSHPRYRALMIRDEPNLIAQLQQELSA